MKKYYAIYNISYDRHEPLCICENLEEVIELTRDYQKSQRVKYGDYVEITEDEWYKVVAGKPLERLKREE
ncbi:hypothetical protein [Fusobacterium mortiferum]|jgi:hypothetical protein|uniref:Uncharacterized protein n=2 Tax=root TaxID=1 RepID=A0ABM6TXP0_FUSMR|nr:hypothetical protein [Fusobacterium mortiferum]AVQ19177.1 hypothetical protein C4N19_08745 [Fusobacterium mortiferum ATCC 9817]EEO35439.1 hypothetical protein FMAG_01001 [Fusobacterium mortiferum ATCC 9817]DAF53776.1 MAG TPA: hypothetical protein [Myoviridae sp. ctZ2t4]